MGGLPGMPPPSQPPVRSLLLARAPPLALLAFLCRWFACSLSLSFALSLLLSLSLFLSLPLSLSSTPHTPKPSFHPHKLTTSQDSHSHRAAYDSSAPASLVRCHAV
eukprot:443949-Rhodomonas_salina.1